jgi:hypothetical protein
MVVYLYPENETFNGSGELHSKKEIIWNIIRVLKYPEVMSGIGRWIHIILSSTMVIWYTPIFLIFSFAVLTFVQIGVHLEILICFLPLQLYSLIAIYFGVREILILISNYPEKINNYYEEVIANSERHTGKLVKKENRDRQPGDLITYRFEVDGKTKKGRYLTHSTAPIKTDDEVIVIYCRDKNFSFLL